MLDTDLYRQQVEETTAFLAARLREPPQIVLVLGTGLSGVAEAVQAESIFSYGELPHFPRSTVAGHAGNLVCGRLGGRRVAVLQGRFHYYEGYSTRELTFPLRVLSRLGAEILLLTNAAGGLNPAFEPGTIMVIRDHLNFIPENPLRGPNVDEWGPRFPDLSAPYDAELRELAASCAARLGLPAVASGVYAAIPGPSLETPAETRWLRSCGADAVGMSSVPEVIVAIHAGMRVLGLSLVSNVNDPDNFQPILLEDILESARRAEPRLQELIFSLLAGLPATI